MSPRGAVKMNDNFLGLISRDAFGSARVCSQCKSGTGMPIVLPSQLPARRLARKVRTKGGRRSDARTNSAPMLTNFLVMK